MDPQQPTESLPQVPPPAPPTPPVPLQSTPKNEGYFARLYSGRLSRKGYWLGILLLMAVPLGILFASALLNFVAGLFGYSYFQTDAQGTPIKNPLFDSIYIILTLIMCLYLLVILPFMFSLPIRRLHDLDKPGILYLLVFAPIGNIIMPIYIAFFPGTQGDNQFGPRPLPSVSLKHDILKFKDKTQPAGS